MMDTRKTLHLGLKSITAAVLLSCMAIPAAQAAELSANLGVVSLYKDRGDDQDEKNKAIRPAVQGGVDLAFDNGLYLGNWNSTGSFGENGHIEIDLYAGYAGEITPDIGFDVGYAHYLYPKESDWNSGEYYLALSYKGLTAKAMRGTRKTINYGDMYYTLSYSHEFTDRLTGTATVGYQTYHEFDLSSKTDFRLDMDYLLHKNMYLTASLAGANRKKEASPGSRKTRFIMGFRAEF